MKHLFFTSKWRWAFTHVNVHKVYTTKQVFYCCACRCIGCPPLFPSSCENFFETKTYKIKTIFRHREDKKEEKRLQRKSCKDAEPRKGDEIFYCVHKHRHTNINISMGLHFLSSKAKGANLPASIARYEKLHVQWVVCAKKATRVYRCS